MRAEELPVKRLVVADDAQVGKRYLVEQGTSPGLPPTFLHTFEADPSVDPSFSYASKLIQAGVYTEVHQWGGSNHSAISNSLGTDPANRYFYVYGSNVGDCLKYDLRRQWLDELK